MDDNNWAYAGDDECDDDDDDDDLVIPFDPPSQLQPPDFTDDI